MDLRLFLSTFALIFVAELPDKTAFAAVLLATRGRPLAVFCGAAAAFTIQSAVSVALGSALGLLPARVVHLASAGLFLLFAFLMWRRRDEAGTTSAETERRGFLKAAWTAFVMIFLAEWGDLTQLATATLSAKYGSPATIFASATLALWAASAVAITVGSQLKHLIQPATLRRLAALAFLIVGVWMMIAEARAAC